MAIEGGAPIEVGTPKSRRSILAGALGGLGAVALQALGRPSPAAAVSNGDVQLGHGTADTDNDATAETRVNGTTDGQVTFTGRQNGSGVGLYGYTDTGLAVKGTGNSSGTGVFGETTSGTGMHGQSATGTGLRAAS